MYRSAVLAALVATLLVPTALAEVGKAEMKFESPSKLVATIEAQITGQQAQEMRQFMDQNEGANEDGTVQQSEVDALEEFFKSFMDGAEEEATLGSSMTMDGKEATLADLGTFDFKDATGPVTSTDAITAYMVMSITFPIEAGETHTLHLEAEDPEGGDESEESEWGTISQTVLKAPSGYVIQSSEGLPEDASVSGDKKSVTFDGSPGSSQNMTVVFAKGGGMGAPSPALVFVVVLLAGVAFLRRRL